MKLSYRNVHIVSKFTFALHYLVGVELNAFYACKICNILQILLLHESDEVRNVIDNDVSVCQCVLYHRVNINHFQCKEH